MFAWIPVSTNPAFINGEWDVTTNWICGYMFRSNGKTVFCKEICKCLSISSIKTIPETFISLFITSACLKISPKIHRRAASPDEILNIEGYKTSPFCLVTESRLAPRFLSPTPNLIEGPNLWDNVVARIEFKKSLACKCLTLLLYNKPSSTTSRNQFDSSLRSDTTSIGFLNSELNLSSWLWRIWNLYGSFK